MQRVCGGISQEPQVGVEELRERGAMGCEVRNWEEISLLAHGSHPNILLQVPGEAMGGDSRWVRDGWNAPSIKNHLGVVGGRVAGTKSPPCAPELAACLQVSMSSFEHLGKCA